MAKEREEDIRLDEGHNARIDEERSGWHGGNGLGRRNRMCSKDLLQPLDRTPRGSLCPCRG